MKVRVQADGQNDERVPHHGDQVHSQEKHREELLLPRWLESPRRRNSEMLVWFPSCIFLLIWRKDRKVFTPT